MTTRKTAQPRKTAAKKTAAPKPVKEESKQMDPDAPEAPLAVADDGTVDVQAHAPFSERNCWAIEVLLREVKNLYHEIDYYSSAVTERGVAIGVTIEGWDTNHDEPSLAEVFAALQVDPRIEKVTHDGFKPEDAGWVNVVMIDNPVTFDIRDPFGLDNVYSMLVRA